MQQDGCEEIQLLISRFVDDEVSPAERKRVEEHVALCDDCAYKLLEFMEMAVLFSETPLKQPDPELRSSLFREIGNIKEDARLKKEAEDLRRQRPRFVPALAERDGKPTLASRFLRGVMQTVSPLAMAAAALFVFLGALMLGNWRSPDAPTPTKVIQAPPVVPTLDAPINAGIDGAPPPVMTQVKVANASPAAPSSSYVNATATLGRDMLIKLTQPTPVWEDGDPNSRASWHTVRDPDYGYSICYPPNWWTRVMGGVRYLYPWTAGGTRYAPYWVEMHVYPNDKKLSADTANQDLCGGKCSQVTTVDGQDVVGLRRTINDSASGNFYDDAYIFDEDNIYQLRVSVPMTSVAGDGDFRERFKSAESLWAMMTGRLVLSDDQRAGNSSFGGVLFLNGTDLWLASTTSTQGSFKVTRGFQVKQFAQSPDLSRVVFTAADPKDAASPWAKAIYLTRISTDGPLTPDVLLSNMEVHDVTWYSDRDVLVLARSDADGLALYKISVQNPKVPTVSDAAPQVDLLVKLPDTLSGAMSLAVSPDRQLVTFLAPVGLNKSTDIYAVRPDGSDLRVIVSHSEPVSPLVGGNLVLAPESQAIKSYLWADGRLEPGGYAANLLFTSGNSSGPISYPGGYLYSLSGASRGPLVDPSTLTTYEPERMQIIPISYSPQGKVALAGYMSDYNQRGDQVVGLWTGDLVRGNLVNVQSQPLPEAPHGVTDLQWSPDGRSLIYRETMPSSAVTPSWRYDSTMDFRLMKLDIGTGQTTLLYNGATH